MCPVYCVTYVTGRTIFRRYLTDNNDDDTAKPFYPASSFFDDDGPPSEYPQNYFFYDHVIVEFTPADKAEEYQVRYSISASGSNQTPLPIPGYSYSNWVLGTNASISLIPNNPYIIWVVARNEFGETVSDSVNYLAKDPSDDCLNYALDSLYRKKINAVNAGIFRP